MVERDPEPVVGVGGEGVDDGEPAPRAVGRPDDLLPLRDPPRDPVGRLPGGGRRVAHREPADPGRGPEVAVHQGGGEQLHVGDVVETRAFGVEGQVVARADVEVEQIADRALVLGAVEALEAAASRERPLGREAVDERLQGLRERLQGGLVGAGGPGRGHQARPHLPDDLLGQRAFASGAGDLEAVQRQVPVARPVVVAAPAGLVHHRLGGFRTGRAGLCRRTRDGPEGEADCDPGEGGRCGVHHGPITLAPRRSS